MKLKNDKLRQEYQDTYESLDNRGVPVGRYMHNFKERDKHFSNSKGVSGGWFGFDGDKETQEEIAKLVNIEASLIAEGVEIPQIV